MNQISKKRGEASNVSFPQYSHFKNENLVPINNFLVSYKSFIFQKKDICC